MRRLEKPTLSAISVFDDCVKGIVDQELADRFSAARAEIHAQLREYDVKAGNFTLYSFAACDWGKKEQIVLAKLSKGELVELYSTHMAAKNSAGRHHYDRLIMLAPLGICPFCGFGHASTLDHFLSKSRYPAFSVLTTNLVPACKDCNTGKGALTPGMHGQMLHPYFEDAILENEAWLFAKVVQSAPATVRYEVAPPSTWSVDLATRVLNHFKDLDLARRFAIQAAPEIIEIGDLLDALGSTQSRQAHLLMLAQIERTKRKNSWKAAMYEALATSDWYILGGYRNAPPLAGTGFLTGSAT